MSSRAPLGLLLASSALAALVGCSGTSRSPATPSSTSPAASVAAGGATIVGLVNGAAAPMTVSAQGTASAASLDSAGRFQLNAIPAGDVTLRFTAVGVDASATVPQVGDQQRVELTVAVSGSTATITSDVRGGSDSSAEAEGAVTMVTGSCPTLTLTIGTSTVKTTAQTTFSGGACADVKVGVKVDAEGVKQADGSITAQSVALEVDSSTQQDLEGDVTSVDVVGQTFKLLGKTVKVTAQTAIRHGSTMLAFTDIKVGYQVHVKGTAEATGTIVASEVNVQNDNPTPPTAAGQASGTVSALTGSCPAVGFRVGGTMVTTGALTTYAGGTCSDLKSGASVDVNGLPQPDKSIAAASVKFNNKGGSGR